MEPVADHPIIEPAVAPLTTNIGRGAGLGPRRQWMQRAQRPLAIASLVALLAVAVFVLLLPETVVERTRAALPSAFAPPSAERDAAALPNDQPVSASPRNAQQPAPFAALALAQEREQAQDALAGFLDLQVRLEDELNARAWGAAELDAAKDRALAGDTLFRDEDYAGAGREYAAAVAALRALLEDAGRRFDAALKEGEAALAKLDERAAAEAFERAARIRPDDSRVRQGRARAARVPELAALLLDADRAALRGNHEKARGLLEEARGIDPATPGLRARFEKVAAARSAKRRKTLLSTAFAALERGDHKQAREEFDRALAEYPGDSAAQAGLQQTEQLRVLAEIETLRNAAQEQALAGNWETALASYEAALAIDSSLRFAREGRTRLRERLELARAIDRILDDPPLLSSNRELAAARDLQLRAQADAETDPNASLDARLQALAAVLEQAAAPVSLVLTSDGATEVVIHKVRTVGVFARTELVLRPGRYVIVGSQDGCRDVRKEIILVPEMSPVDIRCTERI